MNNIERLVFYYGAGKIFVPRPRYFIYNATLRCDLACRHCGVWQAKKRDELEPAELEKIIRGGFFSKVETAWLTGGEPTLRKDLGQIVKVFRRSFPRLKIFGIASNGYESERILARLEEIIIGLDPGMQGLFVHLSLDGIGDVQNRIRGRESAFRGLAATVEGIKALTEKYPNQKIEFGFNCVIQPENVKSLEEINSFAKKYSASLTFNFVEVTDQYYCNQERAAELSFKEEDKEALIEFMRRLVRESGPAFRYQYQRFLAVLSGKKRDRRCLSLYSTFIVDSDGTWIPCPLSSEWLRINFRNQSPGLFWKSREAMELRRQIENRECPDCMLSCSLGDSLSISEFLRGGF